MVDWWRSKQNQSVRGVDNELLARPFGVFSFVLPKVKVRRDYCGLPKRKRRAQSTDFSFFEARNEKNEIIMGDQKMSMAR